MARQANYPIHFKPATHPDVDAALSEHGIHRRDFLSIAKQAGVLILFAPGAMKEATNARYSPLYLRYSLGALRRINRLESRITVMHRLAQQPSSHRVICQAIDEYYHNIAINVLWQEVAGQQKRIPYIHRDKVNLLGISPNMVSRITADNIRYPTQDLQPRRHVPLLPNEELGHHRGLAEATWVMPGGGENAQKIVEGLLPMSKFLISAAHIHTDLS